MAANPLTTQAGERLLANRDELAEVSLRTLLRQTGRVDAMSLSAGDLTIDLSRARANPSTLDMLADLAAELGIPAQLHAMVTGQIVNSTERRPALHTALRLPPNASLIVDGHDVAIDVRDVYERMNTFVDAVHDGSWRGATGDRIRTVVNIGIGGSDLGPRMVTRALRADHLSGIEVRFVANVDPADLDAALLGADPATTLFVIVSKTFTTVETLANAQAARRWLTDTLGEPAVAAHMVAVTAATDRALQFGVSRDAVFGFWDWVGGRYSLSSPVGLATQLAIGSDAMAAFRAGMHRVDSDLIDQDPRSNGALMLGLLDVWYSTFVGYRDKVIVPYAQDLELFPAHLQQLQMESNGKSVTSDGEPTDWNTSPTVWGAPGTNGQHAFFQLLHQGTAVVPVDFIGVIAQPDDERAALLQANLLAQAAALAHGQDATELAAADLPADVLPHRVMPGNRPSTMVLLPALTPNDVGQLIALYEHATVCAGLVWGINPFDQWGVELGKIQAQGLLPAVLGQAAPRGTDPSTRATLAQLRRPSV